MASWQEYFGSTPAPAGLDGAVSAVRAFIARHRAAARRVVLVTSGGTIVPLEVQMVRFLDNFSAGTRGSASAEYFLGHGYAVLFMYRQRSLEPFARRLTRGSLLDYLQVDREHGRRVEVRQELQQQLGDTLNAYERILNAGTLLKLTFTTVDEYLFMLRAIAQEMAVLARDALFYLAAAVSDFYIPTAQMAGHKIQSDGGPLRMVLQQVPKLLAPLVRDWAPEAYTVSFKLETDPALLLPKTRKSLDAYRHQLVIGNLLATRKRRVLLVSPTECMPIELSDDDLACGVEIESLIVAELVRRHTAFAAMAR